MRPLHVGVVGGGIVGLAVARRLLQVRPDARVTVLEKEEALARHQTGRNSGVVHAGIYYVPGSLKATLCRRGVSLLKELCATHGIAYETCGKLIVAFDEEERAKLRNLYERATANRVPGVRLVSSAELRDIEPHAAGLEALHSPSTAIVDFVAVAEALASEVRTGGGDVRTGARVTQLKARGTQVVARTPSGELTFDHLVICAGLHGDSVARLAGANPDPRIVPFRGEYYLLRPERRHLVKGLIYPVPDPRYPFLGVHLTRRHDGEVLVGPNAVLALAREGYGWRTVRLGDLAGTLAWPGFWQLARAHWQMGLSEMAGSLSRTRFAGLARRFVPELEADDLIPGPAGVRAQAVARDGTLVDDFRIDHLGPITAVRNAPSPGATSSLAIAEYIVSQIDFGGGTRSAPA